MTARGVSLGGLWRARHTVRARLALGYAGVFFVSGLVLLAIPAGFVHGGSTSSAVTAHPSGPGTRVDVIARSQHSSDVHQLILGSVVALVVLVAVSGLLGWWLAGRLLRPLRTITETARDISASNLHRRLALAGPDDEFKELGETLDDLFARLEASFDSQRRFVANASHELRTPLTAERTVLQVALADPAGDAESLRVACGQVLALGEQQERLIDALLTLATSERGLDDREPCDLADIAATVLASRSASIERAGLELELALSRAPVDGDRALLDSVVTNLLDNATRYNHPGGRIAIITGTNDDGRTTLTVANTGPTVPPEELARLFRPFERITADRTGASDRHGLGLAIVQAIAEAHHASIRARARSGGGLDIEISFAAG
ncbi:MAG TPA: ATP-binding protein [Mycobacteriales bacterium]|nr:ATP-binding protein [Mycobacteriales bacterium]